MAKKEKLQGRIRYVENWQNDGEHFLFETKWTDEEKWGLESAFKLFPDDVYGGKGEINMIHYTALTTIRQWRKMGVEYHFE